MTSIAFHCTNKSCVSALRIRVRLRKWGGGKKSLTCWGCARIANIAQLSCWSLWLFVPSHRATSVPIVLFLFVILCCCFCRFDMFVVGSIFSAVKFWFVGRCQRSSFDQFRCVVLISFRGDILFLRLYHVPLYRLLSKYKILDLFYRLVSPNTSRQLGWLLETEGEDSSFPRSSSLFPIMELEQLRLLT